MTNTWFGQQRAIVPQMTHGVLKVARERVNKELTTDSFYFVH